ncbi:MAG: PQQ-binding-like beta-propeller repeat protein [Deferribacteres bacterium]|nr:PQQ-binding-like beta-propeller repeat protein [candidate division KSB1 bacterium]MCB9511319.1 PQQ-binding-like beta-propeller repeat protein [Deferribacteres bacterium]
MGCKPNSILYTFFWCAIFLYIGVASAGSRGHSDKNWSQYRGQNRNGVSLEQVQLQAWPAGGPKLVWKRSIGEGFSGISISDGTGYTADSQDSTEFLVAFELKTGKDLWRVGMDKKFFELLGNGPRSTPTIADGMAFGLSSEGMLVAVDAKNGAEKWRVSLAERYAGKGPGRGYSVSPIVDGDLVLIEAAGENDKAIVALDKNTGATRWGNHKARASHSSPVMADIAGYRQYIFPTGGKAISLNGDGEVLWSIKAPPGMIAMPVFIEPNLVFLSGSTDNGCAMLEITESGDSLHAAELWQNRMMINHFNSSTYYQGYIYGFSKATLTCIDAKTGERKWRKRGFGKGSLIVVGGHLVVLSDQGELALIEATPEAYNEVSLFPNALSGKSWTEPAFSDGKLYLRNLKEMVCYDLVN